ncbi:MAG: proton-conducting transporter membrane subunit [Candidatus Omnitrophota bacterium]
MKALNMIPLFVIVPLAAAFLNSLFGRYMRRFAEVMTVVSSGLMLGLSVYARILLESAPDKILVYKLGGWAPPFGICMVLDGFSGLMLVVVNLVAFFVAVYSVGYMEKYTDKPKFFILFSLMVCGMNGVAMTGDMFNLFVFLEVASVASYALVAFGTGEEELEASFKYAVMGSVASSFIFMGIALLYSFTSTLNMADMARVLSYRHSVWVVPFAGVLFLAGFSLKAALIPFHAWLPDAHSSAPASISAMLSGVLIKTLGIYSLTRILFNVIGAGQGYLKALMFFGVISIIIAGMLALRQSDFKRLLAYSSISQIGYIILGISLGTPLGVFGGLFHLFNHSVMKSLLFLNAGAMDYSTGTRDLKEAGGLDKLMPLTSKTNLIASMSISGIPPFSGFFSKLIIIAACVQSGHFGYALCAIIGSVFTLSALMKARKLAFLGEIKDRMRGVKDASFTMKISMVCLAVMCAAGGLMLLPPFRFFIETASGVLLKGTSYANIVMKAVLR